MIMAFPSKVDVGSLFVGECVDELEIPNGIVTHSGKAVRPVSIETFIDNWSNGGTTVEFTILMHGGRVVTVKGHAIKHIPATVAGERDSLGIIVRASEREDFVAIFKANEIDGIFHGQMRVDRTVA